MCYNEEVSVAIYVLGCLGALYAGKSGNRHTSFAIAAIAQVQLFEYFMWADQSCGSLNTFASYAIIWVLFLHVYGLPLASSGYDWVEVIIAIAWAVGAGFLTGDCSEQPELCSTKGDGDRLQWAAMTVLHDKSHWALDWILSVLYFGMWIWVYTRPHAPLSTGGPRMLVWLWVPALALGAGLSVHWAGGNWFDIFGTVWCGLAALAGILSMAYYWIVHGDWWRLVSEKDDHLSLVTRHTLLHIGTGAIIGVVTSHDYVALTVVLGWEVFEYWHAPAFGYWTVLNAGNTAMDIATCLWGYLLTSGRATAPWTYLLIVPGALLAHSVQCEPYDKVSTKPYPHSACLEWMLKQRIRLYPWLLEGVKKLNLRPTLDSYMAPSDAHWVLACVCIAACAAALATHWAVPCLAAFTFGYAMGQPSKVRKTVYDDWYLGHSLAGAAKAVHAAVAIRGVAQWERPPFKCETAAAGRKDDNCTHRGCDPGCCGCDDDCECKKIKPDLRLLY